MLGTIPSLLGVIPSPIGARRSDDRIQRGDSGTFNAVSTPSQRHLVAVNNPARRAIMPTTIGMLLSHHR